MIPILVYFSYKTGALVLQGQDELTRETLIQLKNQVLDGQFYASFQELGYSIYQYVIGSIIFGLGLGLLVGLVIYISMKFFIFIKPK